MSTGQRTAVAGGISAAALGVWLAMEGFMPVAKPPIPGDVPTYGHGLTTHPDGSPVKLGEKISEAESIRQVRAAADGYAMALRRCIGPVATTQAEWDAFVLLAKNVGSGAVCRSSIVPKLQSGQHSEACSTILDFGGITRVINGKRVRLSCQDRANGCYGVWRMRQVEYRMCAFGEYGR